MAKKEGKDGLDKASNAELELLVIGSCHPDDNVKPHNEEAQKFLEHGDLFIGEGKCVAAGIKYQHGRDIEPGNPQLKQRADAIRRYLTQRGELDKMISKYKSEVAQMNVAKEAEEQGFEAPEDMVRPPVTFSDIIARYGTYLLRTVFMLLRRTMPTISSTKTKIKVHRKRRTKRRKR